MDDYIILLHEFVVSRSKRDDIETSWDNHMVLGLTTEIIRLKNKYENLNYSEVKNV